MDRKSGIASYARSRARLTVIAGDAVRSKADDEARLEQGDGAQVGPRSAVEDRGDGSGVDPTSASDLSGRPVTHGLLKPDAQEPGNLTADVGNLNVRPPRGHRQRVRPGLPGHDERLRGDTRVGSPAAPAAAMARVAYLDIGKSLRLKHDASDIPTSLLESMTLDQLEQNVESASQTQESRDAVDRVAANDAVVERVAEAFDPTRIGGIEDAPRPLLSPRDYGVLVAYGGALYLALEVWMFLACPPLFTFVNATGAGLFGYVRLVERHSKR
jgi:hypothetical protein